MTNRAVFDRHVKVRYVDIFCTHIKCEVKHNGEMGMGHLWLKLVGRLKGRCVGLLCQSELLFSYVQKMLVFRKVPFPLIT